MNQLNVGTRLHDAPDSQMDFYLSSFLFEAWSIGPAHVEVGVARALNGKARASEVRAQVFEQGGVADS